LGLFSIFKKLPKIEVGSIWAAPNCIWSNSFARNKKGIGYHPAIVERLKTDQITAILTPGTTKTYKIGSCVFTTKISPLKNVKSHFLLQLSMPYLIDELQNHQNNWWGVQCLSEKQKKELQQQITWCKGTRN